MSESHPLIVPILRGEIHFGNIPPEDRVAIVKIAQTEISQIRATNEPLDDRGNARALELSGEATQAVIVGNLGALSMGVQRIRKPLPDVQEIVTFEDALQDSVGIMGSALLRYDPEQSGIATYLITRGAAAAQRAVNHTTVIHQTYMGEFAYRLRRSLDEIRESQWDEPQPEVYEQVFEQTVSSQLRAADWLETPQERIRFVKLLYALERPGEIITEGETLTDDELTFDHQIRILFDDHDELIGYSNEPEDLSCSTEDDADYLFDIKDRYKNLPWHKLTPYKQQILKMYFGLDGQDPMDQNTIAAIMGKTHQGISWTIRHSLNLLRNSSPAAQRGETSHDHKSIKHENLIPVLLPPYQPLTDEQWQSFAADMIMDNHCTPRQLEHYRNIVNAVFYWHTADGNWTTALKDLGLGSLNTCNQNLVKLSRACGFASARVFKKFAVRTLERILQNPSGSD